LQVQCPVGEGESRGGMEKLLQNRTPWRRVL
jgi:hypothetical protein